MANPKNIPAPELALSLLPIEWFGLYAFLHRYEKVSLDDHGYHLALNHYLCSITDAAARKWRERYRVSPKKNRRYSAPLPWHIATFLWHEMQHNVIGPAEQDFLTRLDQALVGVGRNMRN